VQSAAAQLRDEIDFLEAMIDELASLAESTTNDSVKLGAINSRINAQGRRLELKRAAGLMPWNLRRIGDAIEAKVLADQIFAVIEKHPGHSEILRELSEVFGDDEFRGDPQLEWARAIYEQPQIEQRKTNTIEGKTTNRDSAQARHRAPQDRSLRKEH
jgi:hypothetical protein